MKRFLLLSVVLVLFVPCFGQTNRVFAPSDSLMIKMDSLLMRQKELLEKIQLDLTWKGRFKLYQTENIYTLLQLDTKTGRVKQVQWSLDSDNEGSLSINDDDLSVGVGDFELYPTKNMYQFILLDKTDGRKWHIQWGLKAKERWIRRIW